MTSKPAQQTKNRSPDLVIAFCFIAGGWAFLEWERYYLAAVCFFIALVWPLASVLLTRYQNRLAVSHAEKEQSETEELLKIAKAHRS